MEKGFKKKTMLKIQTINYSKDNYAYLIESADEVAVVDAGSSTEIIQALKKTKSKT